MKPNNHVKKLQFYLPPTMFLKLIVLTCLFGIIIIFESGKLYAQESGFDSLKLNSGKSYNSQFKSVKNNATCDKNVRVAVDDLLSSLNCVKELSVDEIGKKENVTKVEQNGYLENLDNPAEKLKHGRKQIGVSTFQKAFERAERKSVNGTSIESKYQGDGRRVSKVTTPFTTYCIRHRKPGEPTELVPNQVPTNCGNL